MTTMVMNYTVNPVWAILKSIFKSFMWATEVQGYARASAELARLGYHAEAKEVMMKLKELKRS